MNAVLDSLFAYGKVEIKGFLKCPSVFKGMEAPRGHMVANDNGFLGQFSQPGPVAHSEAGDHGGHSLPGFATAPKDPGTAWPEDPFVGTGHEKVAAELLDADILNSQSVYAI